MRSDFPSPRAARLPGRLLLAAAALLLQGLLVANPGYFSHDELQWAARAAAGAGAGWTDIGALQYRPLTFQLWLWLSRALFDTPRLFHLAVVLLGVANVLLLSTLLRRAGARPRVADAAALLFAAGPYAMYVHGWVGTLGDILWLGCALATGCIALRAGPARAALAAAALTAAGLLAKEAALSIPAMAAVLVLADPARRRTWLAVATAAGAVSLAYLALRYPALAAPGPGDAYAWSAVNLPLRWLEYQLYLPHAPVFEVHNVFAGRGPAAVAGLAWLALTAVIARRGRGWLVAWLLGGAAALGPVLVLGQAATQYGYAFAAWCAGLVGLAWAQLPRSGRRVAGVFAVLTVLHGLNVARQMHRVGDIEARFSAAVLPLLADAPSPLRLAPEPDADAWIFQRVTHGVPTYRGVPFSPRIEWVAPGAPADYGIRADGSLAPAR